MKDNIGEVIGRSDGTGQVSNAIEQVCKGFENKYDSFGGKFEYLYGDLQRQVFGCRRQG